MTIEPKPSNSIVERLVREKAASRIHAKDATLYGFSQAAQQCARDFMGWSDLASNPPCSIEHIQQVARSFIDAGFEDALLIGQGGSTQAAMTLTKCFQGEQRSRVGMRFRVLDSDSPVRLRKALGEVDPAHTLVIAASKSGSTLEMKTLLAAVSQEFLQVMDQCELSQHLVAITDPGSGLERRAKEEGWAAILHGEPTVGGRFSALSVFGLFPAALVGISLDELIAQGRAAEEACARDAADNPAVQLAAFLFGAYEEGRNKLAYVAPKQGRVLGLWIEQLLAESTGKEGKGILPYLETEPAQLEAPAADRAAVIYRLPGASSAEAEVFEASARCIDASIPRVAFEVASAAELAWHFMVWEYATALCGYLMGVCPFDQPDVASAKACVSEILSTGLPEPDFCGIFASDAPEQLAELKLSPNLDGERSVRGALKALLQSIQPGDYFAINAFVPFEDDARKQALEDIRCAVASCFGVASCLEIGPRYLHSTGQLQKGGPNQGVYLVLSGNESDDIALEGQASPSLGTLEHAQAAGDASVLMERGRRCLYVHLPDNHGVTLRRLADLVSEVLADLQGRD